MDTAATIAGCKLLVNLNCTVESGPIAGSAGEAADNATVLGPDGATATALNLADATVRHVRKCLGSFCI